MKAQRVIGAIWYVIPVRIIGFVLLGFLLAPIIFIMFPLDARGAETCRPADIEVKGLRKIKQPGPFIFVVGEVTNHCKAPAQVLVTLTLRNDAGEIVDVIPFVGGERGPLDPGESYVFKAMAAATEADTATKIESAVTLHRH